MALSLYLTLFSNTYREVIVLCSLSTRKSSLEQYLAALPVAARVVAVLGWRVRGILLSMQLLEGPRQHVAEEEMNVLIGSM